jgi:protein subunit release factor A
MQLRLEDVQMDVWRAGARCPLRVRVLHLPTGKMVERVGFVQFKLREEALKALEQLLHDDAG